MKNKIQFSILLFFCFTNLLRAQVFDQYNKTDTLQNDGLMKLHYQPFDDGYQIVGSNNIFNRALYMRSPIS